MAEASAYVPTAGVYMAMIEYMGGNPRKVIEPGVREWAKRYGKTIDTMLKAAGVELAPPADRLYAYLLWTLEDWQRKWAKYPQRFLARWKDFEKLRERAKAGDFGDEVMAVVMEHWSETVGAV